MEYIIIAVVAVAVVFTSFIVINNYDKSKKDPVWTIGGSLL